MTQAATIATYEKFQNAEQLWFWFLYSRSVRNNAFTHVRAAATQRPCEILDVETLITKLYLFLMASKKGPGYDVLNSLLIGIISFILGIII